MSSVDGSVSDVKYLQIANKIKEKIYSEIYAPYTKLPSENKLCDEYQVSRLTIREALTTLIDEGFIYTIPGKASFVNDFSKFDYTVNLNFDHVVVKNPVYSLDCAKIIDADIYTVYHLRIAPEDKVVYISGFITVENQVVAYDERYVPYTKGIPMDPKSLEFKSFIQLFKKTWDVRSLNQTANIKGGFLDLKLKRLMDLPENCSFPCVFIEKKIFSKDQKPLGYNRLYVLKDYFKLEGVSIL